MYLYELEPLENIIEQIVPEDKPKLFCNETSKHDFNETILELMDEYMRENPTLISDPDFHSFFLEDIKDIFLSTVWAHEEQLEEDELEELDDCLEDCEEYFFEHFYPVRSFDSTFIFDKPINKTAIKKHLEYLKNIPQPAQRTKEWYEFRHNLITASNAYKVFENEATRNQLIFEKCQPLITSDDHTTSKNFVNINTTLHWGQKYEPISVLLYEHMYKTTVGDFGCIQHSNYSFLGASPDGINIDPNNRRYGRMLEIKNIVNREIDGVPKKEYWIQMQLQMEICDLDECDFLETKFTEYEDESSFLEDDGEKFYQTKDGDFKGVIMYFCNQDGNPVYVYKPLLMEKEEFELWEMDQMDNIHKDETWIKNIYWKLDVLSCVLVLRNKQWFQDNVCELEKTWKIIENDRKEGYKHRAPIKKKKEVEPINSNTTEGVCLIQLNKESGKTIINNEEPQVFSKIIKIRTESIDETLQKNNL